jgi:Fur family ferric uptake transcriptional regulator
MKLLAGPIIIRIRTEKPPPHWCYAAIWRKLKINVPRTIGRTKNATATKLTTKIEAGTIIVAAPEKHISERRNIEALCAAKGMRMTEQRRTIAHVLAESDDHPDVEELYRRCSKVDDRISISTVYRTVRLFEDSGIIERHDFREGRARYETSPEAHHDHLINLRNGEVIEFQSEEIERLQAEVARKLGYKLIDHRLELYAVPLEDDQTS